MYVTGSHDANLCLVVNGTVLSVVELERVFDVRYFMLDPGIFRDVKVP